MASYRELQAQVEKLMAQAEEQRLAEMADAVARVVATMSEFGISLADLRAHIRSTSEPTGKAAKKITGKAQVAEPKYKDPKSDATWTGRGRAPAWMVALEESGKSRDKFLIKS